MYSPYNGDVHSPGKHPFAGGGNTLVVAAVLTTHTAVWVLRWPETLS